MSFLFLDKKYDSKPFLATFLKILFLVLWLLFLILLLRPSVVSEINTFLAKGFFYNYEDIGMVFSPMRPLSDKITMTSNTAFAASSAPNLKGFYVSGSFTTTDMRIYVLQEYLKSKGSPMAPYADYVVRASDQNNIDYKVFVAISGVESGFGKLGRAAVNGYNPIGWRGGYNGTFSSFNSWSESIPALIGGLARGYGSNPNPFAIQSRYCPPCEAAGTNEWANGVKKHLNEIDYYYNLLK